MEPSRSIRWAVASSADLRLCRDMWREDGLRGSPKRAWFAVFIALAAFVVTITPVKAADDAGRADALLAEGVALRRQGRDFDALRAFEAAMQLQPSSRAQAQVGLAQQALGRWVDAERSLRAALASKNDPWVAHNARELTDALKRIEQHIGELYVVGEPEGAQVSVNDVRVGTLPMAEPVRVAGGDLVVTVSAPGYFDISRKVNVPSGGVARETIALPTKAPAVGASRAATSVESPRPVPANVATVPGAGAAPLHSVVPPIPVDATNIRQGDPRGDESNPMSRPLRIAAWSTAGAAAVALLVGAIADVKFVNDTERFNSSDSGCGTDVPRRGGESCERTYDTLGRERAVALVGFAAAVSVGATSAILFWLSRHRTERSSRIACAATLTEGGCALFF